MVKWGGTDGGVSVGNGKAVESVHGAKILKMAHAIGMVKRKTEKP